MSHNVITILYFYFFIDIKECENGLHNCDQICLEFEGAFECACNAGYELDNNNATCSGKMYSMVKGAMHLCSFIMKPFKTMMYMNLLLSNFKQDGGYYLSASAPSMNLHQKQKSRKVIVPLSESLPFI